MPNHFSTWSPLAKLALFAKCLAIIAGSAYG